MTGEYKAYFGNEDEFHMCFNFPLMPRIFISLARQSGNPIIDIIKQTLPIPATCDWGIFLRNHDELTLEMVTDEERDIMYSEYAKLPKMRLNLGIRRRLAPLVDNERSSLELLNALLLSIPGSPILYYGDELGMGDNIYLGDRNGVRTPMQWSFDRNAGFSRADTEALYSPVIMSRSSSVTISSVNSSWFLRNIPQSHVAGIGSVCLIMSMMGFPDCLASEINILGIRGKLKHMWNSSSFPK